MRLINIIFANFKIFEGEIETQYLSIIIFSSILLSSLSMVSFFLHQKGCFVKKSCCYLIGRCFFITSFDHNNNNSIFIQWSLFNAFWWIFKWP